MNFILKISFIGVEKVLVEGAEHNGSYTIFEKYQRGFELEDGGCLVSNYRNLFRWAHLIRKKYKDIECCLFLTLIPKDATAL